MRRRRHPITQVDLSIRSNHHLLVWLDAQCFPEDLPAVVPGAAWWVAGPPTDPVAYAAVKVKLESSKPVAYMYRAGVMPAARGTGLQRRLLSTREVWAKRQGIAEAVTCTSVENAASMRSLIGAGYRPFNPNAWTTLTAGLVHWRKLL